jgi:hypothetical protein
MNVAYLYPHKLVISIVEDGVEVPLAGYTFERYRSLCIDHKLDFNKFIEERIRSACEWLNVEKIINRPSVFSNSYLT